MKIEKDINEQYIEGLLQEKDISFLEIPNTYTNMKFDLRARFFQVLTTLISKYEINKIIVRNLDIDKQENLYKRLEFIGCLSRVKELVSSTDIKSNKIEQYVNKLKDFLHNMDSFENLPLTLKGQGFQVMNFDWREEFCYWKTVYNNKKFIDEEKFIQLYSKSIIDTTHYSRKDVKLNSITEILYELYKNTHDHARSTIISELSIRGFYTNKNFIESSEINKHVSYKNYFNKISVLQQENRAKMEFIELSVFDSGKGFFHTFKGVSPLTVSHKVEKKGTLECFEKYMTSKGSSTYGRGLESVLKNLKAQKGLLILRTGRMKIIIDGLDLKDDFDLSDTQCDFYEYIKGTSITLILPKSIEEGNLFS